MKNVIFGNYDAYNDFSLIRTGMTIGTPTIKKRSVEIEGADGELDLTEYFGDVNYNNRTLSFEFKTAAKQDEFMELFSNVQNALHGRRMKVIPSDELDCYYMGRINVSEWKADKAIGTLTIDVDADPYKYKNNPTVVSRSVNGSLNISCYNLRKRTTPTITVTAATTLVYGGTTYSLSAGTYDIPEIIFTEGTNILGVTTNGTITITYQEGKL